MHKFSLLLMTLLSLSACKTTVNSTPDGRFANLPVTNQLHATGPFRDLARLEPMYPVEEARGGGEGCATIEYVVTPDYQLYDVVSRDASSRFFAREARAAVSRWQWQQLPAGLLTEPAKLQTRFEFCLETVEGRCDAGQLAARTQCSGDDVLPVVGYRVRVN
ncbi:TonB domain-containing protein [Alishewanella agri BL06]|uniref:TonB domain-containing protein n=1 Tax=Alishewanella agri BL06 TaxID=1195246 RepID=I8UBH2_9ALTE|nr:energy transducer TonB [Alishewanella agri]EIW90616.1 TonB domain-containing protein [Alishewanella agri BL06]